MRVRILDSAHNDIRDGYWFYENQEPGVGDYFSDTLYGEDGEARVYGVLDNRRNPSWIYSHLQKERNS